MKARKLQIWLVPLVVAVGVVSAGTARAQSVEAYEESVRRAPQSDVAHYCLANALFKAGQSGRAVVEYKQAYALARGEQMRGYCSKMLDQLGVHVAGSRSAAGMQVRAPGWMPQTTSAPISKFQEMAKTHGAADRISDSHRDGVPRYDKAPGADFDSWITEFRMNFGKQLNREMYMRGYRSMFGTTQMVFGVDHNHKLRARILRSTAPPHLTDCLLATTRALDGHSVLDFPRNSDLDGFNFAMSWTFPEYPRSQADVTAALRNPYGRVNATAAMQASQGVLNYGTVNGNLASKNASGQLLNKGASSAVAGKLDAGKVTFTTDVAGLLLPKPKPVELKAKPALKLENK